MVYLAFYQNRKKLFDKIVGWRTNSDCVHVELYLSDYGQCFSSSQWDGGTRWKTIDVHDESKWLLVEVHGVSEEKVRAAAEKFLGRKYDLPNILRIMAGIRQPDTSKIVFCSEVAVRILQVCWYGVELLPDRVTPDNLLDYARGHRDGWEGGSNAANHG